MRSARRFLVVLLFMQTALHSKIYDCFTFLNEVELLRVRLEELDDVVDYFVLVEGTLSFNGAEKPLFFQKNSQLFDDYKHKIIHVIADDFPQPTGNDREDHWKRQAYSRNCIMKGLGQCAEDDIIFISDLDEIPRKEAVIEVQNYLNGLPEDKRKKGASLHKNAFVCELDMRFFMFKLNLQNTATTWVGGSKAVPYWFLKTINPWDVKIYQLRDHGQGIRKTHRILDAGWHFHAMGGSEQCIYKWQTTYSVDEAPADVLEKLQTDREFMENYIREKSTQLTVVPIDATYPHYILEHLDSFREMGWLLETP